MTKHRTLLLLFLLLLSCGCQKTATWQKTTLLYFDTVCELNLFCSPSVFTSAQEKVTQIFSAIEDLFAPCSSDFSSPWTLDLFRKAAVIHHDSNGSFDITIAPLTRLWGFQSGSPAVPEQSAISSALGLVGMSKAKIRNDEIVLEPGMSFDWGGIAKGYGIDLAAEALILMGIPKGFVNAGGDLYCWGTNPEEKPWQIGIKHPRRNGFLGVLAISNLGAATTGDYQRFFIQDGIRYHHVFNPKTGFPARGMQSVTVIGPEACICDALSTALFVSDNTADILEKHPDYGAVLVDSEGKITCRGKSYLFRAWE